MVPLLDLAQRQVLGDGPKSDVVEDAPHVPGFHFSQDHQRLAGQPHVDQRLLGAKAEAPHRDQFHVAALMVDAFGEGMVYALGAVARAAGAHSHSDSRPRRQQLRHTRFAHRAERADILNAGHDFLPFKCSSSRCRVCSFMWP